MSEPSPTPAKIAVNRTLVGILAVICLGTGAVLLFRTSTAALGGAFLRVGVLLGALWLALPLRRSSTAAARVSPFVLVGALGAMMFVVRRPAVLVPSLVLLGVIWLLLRPWHPHGGKRPVRQNNKPPSPPRS